MKRKIIPLLLVIIFLGSIGTVAAFPGGDSFDYVYDIFAMIFIGFGNAIMGIKLDAQDAGTIGFLSILFFAAGTGIAYFSIGRFGKDMNHRIRVVISVIFGIFSVFMGAPWMVTLSKLYSGVFILILLVAVILFLTRFTFWIHIPGHPNITVILRAFVWVGVMLLILSTFEFLRGS